MKIINSLVLALGMIVVAVVRGQTEPNCANTELSKLSPIAKSTSPYQTCKPLALGFTLIPITGEPTEAQWKGLCNAPSCSETAATIRNITTLSDCKIVNTATSKSYNVFRFARDYDKLCAPYTPAPPTAAPTPVPTSVAPTPAPTTAEPTLPPKPSC
ncbi:hypothetical protein PybrP1_000438 [[Pythium] brassicae (nom. inval.)]|nr:hypothetical protein PybrP1_000438 [[Pythium] brassicae (nom. inval.)]